MLKHLLCPFTLLYGLVIKVRNCLFHWKILRSTPIKGTICVGNLTVGGTGKTPFTEYLINLLKDQTEIAVLSRGYKRKTKGFVMADAKSSAAIIGDEPYQIYLKHSEIPIAVDEDRINGIQTIRHRHPNNRVIILDDAFQHRRVKAGLNILLTDYHNPIYSDYFLPVGRLRDSFAQRKRAQMIVVTKCPENLSQQEQQEITKRLRLLPHQELFFSTIKYGSLKPVFPLEEYNPLQLTEQLSIIALAGIANPAPFFNFLKKRGNVERTISLGDHQPYQEKKIKAIFDLLWQIPNKAKAIVTTEKDAARLKEFAHLPQEMKRYFYYLPIEMDFLEGYKNDFNLKVQAYVNKT